MMGARMMMGRRPRRPGTAGGRPGTAGSRPGTAGSRPGTAGSRPRTGGSRPKTAGSRPQTAGSRPGTARGDSEAAVEARPVSAHRRRHPRPPSLKKKKKGMWSMCSPTIAYCGVICCLWLPKLFMVIGVSFSVVGSILLILGSVEKLNYAKGKTTGAIVLSFGLIFVIVSSVALFLKKWMKTIPDEETGELRVTFTKDRKDDYAVTEQPERPSSAAPYDPYDMGSFTDVTRPRSSAKQRPVTANGVKPAASYNGGARPKNSTNGRPGSALSVIAGTGDYVGPGSAAAAEAVSRGSSPRPGTAGSSRPGTAGSSRPSSSTSSRQNSRPSSARKVSPSPPGTGRSSRTANNDGEIDYRPDPFMTEVSGKMNGSRPGNGHLPGGLRTTVEVHTPPVINVISSNSFANDGYDDVNDNIIAASGFFPGSIGEPMDETLAISAPPSPRYSRRSNSIKDIDTDSIA